jgi:hypothetical protein
MKNKHEFKELGFIRECSGLRSVTPMIEFKSEAWDEGQGLFALKCFTQAQGQ